MSDVVLLAMTPGPAWVDALRRIWDAGDAVAPIDPTAPQSLRSALVEALRPTAVVEGSGERRTLDGGLPAESGDALVMATSGTSGSPKGVVLTHIALEAAARITSAGARADSSSTWLACLPLHHIGGFGVLSRALLTGSGLVVQPGIGPSAIASVAADVTHTSLVPAVLDRVDPAAFEAILLGGSAIPAERPPNTIATYGMTESGGGVVYDGRPLEGVEVRVDDSGELSLRSPTLLRAYRDGRVPLDEHGWYPTGDLGRVHDDGTIEVRGRADDVIVTGGEKVWPGPVEELLAQHPGVADVAVVARPDEHWGQAVTALVVPVDRAHPPALEELRELVKSALPPFAAPHALELVERIPRTSLGKPRRREV
jgi:O-succinylbenzoic acid--CoA ligase